MSIPDRMANLAKNYLQAARSRWDEIDAAAQLELDEHVASPALSAFERAQAKIRAVQADTQSSRELASALADQGSEPIGGARAPQQVVNQVAVPPLVAPTSENALNGAYKILGVAEGSDFATVQKAYQDLRQRADPSRFDTGSPEQKMAEDIQKRVNASYIVLANALSPASENRFDRLEF